MSKKGSRKKYTSLLQLMDFTNHAIQSPGEGDLGCGCTPPQWDASRVTRG